MSKLRTIWAIIVWTTVVTLFVYLWQGMHLSFLRSLAYTAIGYLIFVISVFLFMAAAGYIVCYCPWFPLPICLQRPFYESYKVRLKKYKIHPLIDYPFAIFIEFNLDEEFEKGGIKGAQQAAIDWVEDYKNRMSKVASAKSSN